MPEEVFTNHLAHPTTLPLARAFMLKQLTGWLGKSLEVPPGRQGISLDSAGRLRLFPPGRQTVLSAFERLAGRGAGLRAGYIPDQGFQAGLKIPNLLSGDSELLDASLLCQVEVADPARFFAELVIPQEQLNTGPIELSGVLASESIAPLAARYEAADLVRGLPTPRLAAELSTVLEPALAALGLRLVVLQWIAFWRAEQRLEIATKAQALEERLKELELDKELAALERQAQKEDFLRQFQDEVELRPVAAAQPPAEPTARTLPPVETLPGWLVIDAAQENTKRRWRFENLFGGRKKSTEEPHPSRRQIKRFFIWRLVALVFLTALACVFTALMYRMAQNTSSDVKWEVLVILWSPVLTLLVESAVEFFKKREALADNLWQAKGVTALDDLSRDNRQRADRLVREQCAGDLLHVREILQDVRSRVYAAGNELLALRLRELERKVDAHRQDFLNPQFGAAPYMSDLRLTRQAWDNMLDQDEELLARSAQLSNQASELQQKVSSREALDPLGAALENKLDELWHLFANRAQALRSQPAKSGQSSS
jgi:hypothetical protein